MSDGMSDDQLADELIKLNATPEEQKLYWLARRQKLFDDNWRGYSAGNESSETANNFHLTDLGNAKRLVRDHSAHVRYVSGWGWLIYDGTRWEKDSTMEVYRLAKGTVLKMYEEAARVADDDRRKALITHALKSQSEVSLRRLLELTKSEIEITASPELFDNDPFLFNCETGTIDLRTGTLRPHMKKDFLTKLSPVEYDYSAACPQWTAFLNKIMNGDKALIKFLQRMVGYMLSGDTSEQCLFIAFGVGANGKSTLINILKRIVGEYGMQSPAETFLAKKTGGIPNDMARLVGARVVTVVETDLQKRLAEGLIKSITGNDTVAVRFLYKEFFECRLILKLIIVTNHKPRIIGQDLAIWRRIRLIPFNVSIPLSEQDKHLETKLASELPGILAWAVEGCIEWQRDGLGMPDAVVSATSTYKSDMACNVTQFINSQYEAGTSLRVKANELYKSYTEWCTDNGEEAVDQKLFKTHLLDLGLTQKRTGKNGSNEWHGTPSTEGLKGTEGFFHDFLYTHAHEKEPENDFSNPSVLSSDMEPPILEGE